MARLTLMHRFARWHIWLGWVVALPILLWISSGLFMALRPIDEVRGTTLRIERPAEPVRLRLPGSEQETLIREGRMFNQRGRSILLATFPDGSVGRIDLDGPEAKRLPPADEAEARLAVRRGVTDGAKVASVRLFDADHPPFDLRKPIAAWQVTLEDGTHVYVGRDSGEIEALRTRWWRAYDLMWGLHIMDPVTRENTSNLLLWIFSTLALAGSLIGTVLLFRRRKAKR